MKKILLLLPLIFLSSCYDAASKTVKGGSSRFKVYKTDNMYTLLLLDTRTGRLWQTAYTTNNKSFEGDIPISSKYFAHDNGSNGRFILTKTDNMWTYIMTDTESGAQWHCQFSIKNEMDRFCYKIVAPKIQTN